MTQRVYLSPGSFISINGLLMEELSEEERKPLRRSKIAPQPYAAPIRHHSRFSQLSRQTLSRFSSSLFFFIVSGYGYSDLLFCFFFLLSLHRI
ncbi:unnamed protein product [Cuscuta epithymum]|uniref:Uncharacterized protein n=1 Tax=Cuscuta epithymum TaxID=186058 RepID=A0AAV0G279_9ASTE|nr:unnamed protein product [Cuscuta epithymum]